MSNSVGRSERYPKSRRLLKRRDYIKVTSKGKKFVGKTIALEYLPSSFSRLGIVASRKFGKSHERNKFKRQIREIFRKYCRDYPLDIVIFPRKGALYIQYEDLKTEVLNMLTSISQKQ